jgi:hypothetical protein
MRFGIPSAGMVGRQGVAAPVDSRLVCQPCFICQLLHHCVNASLLLYQLVASNLKDGVRYAGITCISKQICMLLMMLPNDAVAD